MVTNLILFVERLSKAIIALKPEGRKAVDIENSINEWLQSVPKNLFISIKPADQEHPYGHERFEYISGLFVSIIITYVGFQFLESSAEKIIHPEDGLPKEMEFNQVNQGFISSVASKRNHIPRKSLNYQTPLEVFLS
ncbi:hypothetical protein EfmAA290_13140 [Enterococcus faecium]|nr:hypothetical protein EfmAA290_13140 [Enterococcus faecium]